MLVPNRFNGYRADGRRLCYLDMGGDPPPPPDYTPMANASKEAAEIAAQMGREQLAEGQRQYDQNMAVARPVVDAQLGLMNQAMAQGADYYEYGKNFRPLEMEMLSQVRGGLTPTEMVRLQRAGYQVPTTAMAKAPAPAPRPAASTPKVSDAEIKAFVNANLNDPKAIERAAADYGVSQEDIKRATGYNSSEVASYLGRNNIDIPLTAKQQLAQQPQMATTPAPDANMQGATLRAMLAQDQIDQITNETRSNADLLRRRTSAYEQDAARDIGLFTGGNQGIYDKYRQDIDADIGNALADTRTGQTSALNSALRQAMRYGLSVPTNAQALTNQNAAQLAAAANNTRNSAIDNYRAIVGQGIGLKRDAFATGQGATMDAMSKGEGALRARRDMEIQNDSLDWAKKLDVTGMARGMPGASQGAYGVAVGAGNSAVQNQMAPGSALLGAMNQSNNTTMQGQQLAMQGIGNVLNAQTSYANAVANSGGDTFGSLLGGIGGAAAGLAKIGVFS